MLPPLPSPVIQIDEERLGAVGNTRYTGNTRYYPILETNPFKKSSSLPSFFENLINVYSTFGNGIGIEPEGDMVSEHGMGAERIELELLNGCQLNSETEQSEPEMSAERVKLDVLNGCKLKSRIRRVNEVEGEVGTEKVNYGEMGSEDGESENEIVYVTEVETQTEHIESDEVDELDERGELVGELEMGAKMNGDEKGELVDELEMNGDEKGELVGELEMGAEMNDERIGLEGEMGSEDEGSENEIVHVSEETQTEYYESDKSQEFEDQEDQESVFFSMGEETDIGEDAEETDISEDSLETTVVYTTHDPVYHRGQKNNGEIDIVIDPDITFKKK